MGTLRHFETTLGTGELVSSRAGVEICKWPDSSFGEGFVLATVGMAEKPLARRIELLMLCARHDVEALAQVLLDLADYSESAKPSLHWFHVLPIGRAVVPDSALVHLLLTFPPYDSEFVTFENGGHRIDVLWVIPISEGERAIFDSKGVDALQNRLEERNVDVSDLFRSSVA